MKRGATTLDVYSDFDVHGDALDGRQRVSTHPARAHACRIAGEI
jgi:hypothetical protein